jgi:diguanylate cyclase (GGDEF)-like protein/PAS domain S-box-containing protein
MGLGLSVLVYLAACVGAAAVLALLLPETMSALTVGLTMSGLAAVLFAWFAVSLRRRDALIHALASKVESKYRQVVEKAGEGIVIVEGGLVRYANPRMLDLTGYSEDELAGMPFEEFLHPDFRERDLDRYRRRMNGEDVADIFQTRILCADGRHMDVEANVTDFDHEGRQAHLVFVRDITDRLKTQERIRRLALYDPLTGLANRHLFFDRMEQALARARRGKTLVGLLYIDLDGFKEVNDTFGHKTGDRFLKIIAHRISGSIRESDTAARIGGDEFVVILPGLDAKEEVWPVVHKIRTCFLDKALILRQESFLVRASIGVSFYPVDADNPDDLLRKADEAMYQAKQEDKGGVRFHSETTPSMGETA